MGAYAPDLDDCVIATGKTREETVARFRDALHGLIKYKHEEGLPAPNVTELEIRETVAAQQREATRMALRKLSSDKEVSERPRGADQKRLSAQELALAVTALEQRQAEAAQSQGETLSVDEAVRELGLPFSPQEVWAEVQARRRRLTAETKSPSRFRAWVMRRKKAAGLTLAAALLASTVAYGVQTRSTAEELAKYPVQHITLADVSQYEIVREPTAQGIRVCTLAEVPDDTTVLVNGDTLFLDNQYVDQNTQNDAPKYLPHAGTSAEPSVWRVIRHDGWLYVRGWIACDVSASAARLSGITLYSTPTALGGGHRMIPITMPATRGWVGSQNLLTSRAVGGNWESIHFDRARMDKRAWERW